MEQSRLRVYTELTAMTLVVGLLAFNLTRCSEAECDEGDAQCLGTQIQTCEAGVWQAFNECSIIGMTCATMSGSPTCVTPAATCDNNPSTPAPPCGTCDDDPSTPTPDCACDNNPSTPAPPC